MLLWASARSRFLHQQVEKIITFSLLLVELHTLDNKAERKVLGISNKARPGDAPGEGVVLLRQESLLCPAAWAGVSW